MKTNMKRRRGFTLVELIITIVVVGIILLTLTGFLTNGLSYHAYNSREFSVQTDVKYVATHVGQQIKNATVTFIVTADDYSGRAEGLTPGWNYIGQNEAGTQLVEFIYNKNTGKHDKRVLTQGAPGMKYEVIFDKDNETDDKLVAFDVTGWLEQRTSSAGGDHRYSLNSRVSADRSNMVFSRATPTKPGIALAHRSDPIPKGLQINLTMVLDNSGSMAWDMYGNDGRGAGTRRIEILKEETHKLIDDFASIGFVNIVLSPFGSEARHTSRRLYNIVSDRETIDNAIDAMNADRGTNVGDGMRTGFHKMFDSSGRDPLLEQKDYAIILTDGAANGYTIKSEYAPTKGQGKGSGPGHGHGGGGGQYQDPYKGRDYPEDAYPIGPTLPQGAQTGGGYNDEPDPTRAKTYIRLVYNHFGDRLDKVFVIGFSALRNDKIMGNTIGTLTGGGNPASNYYDASSSDELRAIYKSIRDEITRELWYVMGP